MGARDVRAFCNPVSPVGNLFYFTETRLVRQRRQGDHRAAVRDRVRHDTVNFGCYSSQQMDALIGRAEAARTAAAAARL